MHPFFSSFSVGHLQVTVSKAAEVDGPLPLHSATFRLQPLEIHFSTEAQEKAASTAAKMSVDVGSRTLYIAALQGGGADGRQPQKKEEQPVELTFQEHYGSIRSHLWFGDDMLLIGFASGGACLLARTTRA